MSSRWDPGQELVPFTLLRSCIVADVERKRLVQQNGEFIYLARLDQFGLAQFFLRPEAVMESTKNRLC